MAAPMTMAAFLTGGSLMGVAIGVLKTSLPSRSAASVLAYAAALPLSAGALVSSHGTIYLERLAHWLVISAFALVAPAMSSVFWPSHD